MRSYRKSIVIVAVLLILVIAGSATGLVLLNSRLNKIKRVGNVSDLISPEDEDFETEENPGLEVVDPDTVNWSDLDKVYGNHSIGDEDLLNILLVGQDRRPGETRARSDTMIVVSVNTKTKQASIVSFLRDLYVQIPGYSDNRLNAAYCFGGFPLLKDTIYVNFGMHIDGCFEVDFDGFRTLINALGGIDVSLSAAEAEIVGVQEGQNHLDGRQALIYARIRKIGTDFGRTTRQRTVLLAAFEKVKHKGIKELISLIDTALPYISTDLSNAQIYALAAKVIPMATSMSISTHYIPPDESYRNVYIKGMAVLLPDLVEIRDILKNEYLPMQ